MIKKGYKKSKDGDIEEIDSEKDAVDPFDQFGHGIQAYFRMMRVLIVAMLCISLLFVPVIYLYYSGGAFKSTGSILNQINLGNLGHAEHKCAHQFKN